MRRIGAVVALPVVLSCGAPGGHEGETPGIAASEAVDPAPRLEAEAILPTVAFLGDSLTAGFGLPEDEAFPAVLGGLLAAEGTPVEVLNAGVSGDTSAGGVTRVDWLLRQNPDVLVVGLGANDGLRGHALTTTEANLRRILEAARGADVEVVLLGMKIPPSHGLEYFEAFESMYPRLAREFDVELVEFLLEGVAARPGLNLEDGIHPNPAGHRILAANVLPALRRALARALDESQA